MPSLVAEIGHALEKHLIMIGLMKPAKIPAHQQKILDDKRAQFDSMANSDNVGQGIFQQKRTSVKKCHIKATILMDGCLACLNCGDSKCG